MGHDRRLIAAIALALCGGIGYFYWNRTGPNRTADGAPPSAAEAVVHGSPPMVSGTAIANANANPPAATAPKAAEDADDPDKHAIIIQIRATVVSDPQFAEALIREDQERFPDSPDADERDASLVSVLFNERRMYDAQLEAISYFRRHPGGRYTDYLIRDIHVSPPPRPIEP